MLRMSEAEIRFIEPDVGGSFGARGEFYPEDFLIPWLAMRLKKPVRWIEDRFEHFAAINHSREMTFEVTAAADARGILTAFDVRLFCRPRRLYPHPRRCRSLARLGIVSGAVSGTQLSCAGGGDAQQQDAVRNNARARHVRGQFRARARDRSVWPTRLVIERAEFRRRNLIGPGDMPWAVGTESVRRPTIFDSGDFPLVFEQALQEFGWDIP